MIALSALDIVVLLILTLPFFLGVFRGFFRAIFGLAGSIVGFGTAMIFARPIGDILGEVLKFKESFFGRVIAFIIIYFGFWFTGTAAGFFFKNLFKRMKLGWLDRLMGGMLGLAKGSLLIAAILIVLSSVETMKPIINESLMGPPLIQATRYAIHLLPESWQHYLNPKRWMGNSREFRPPENPPSPNSTAKEKKIS